MLPRLVFTDIPPTNSFCRMLTHKLADYYKLTHSFDAAAGVVRIFRTPFCQVPPSLASIAQNASTAASTSTPVSAGTIAPDLDPKLFHSNQPEVPGDAPDTLRDDPFFGVDFGDPRYLSRPIEQQSPKLESEFALPSIKDLDLMLSPSPGAPTTAHENLSWGVFTGLKEPSNPPTNYDDDSAHIVPVTLITKREDVPDIEYIAKTSHAESEKGATQQQVTDDSIRCPDCSFTPQAHPNRTQSQLQQALNKHRQRTHSRAIFLCPVPGCKSTLTRSDNIKAHIRRQHPTVILEEVGDR